MDFTICKTGFSTGFYVESVENSAFFPFFCPESVENSVENVKNGFRMGFSMVERSEPLQAVPSFFYLIFFSKKDERQGFNNYFI